MAKTAAYCEGMTAFRLGRDCKYAPDAATDRADWAKGYLDAWTKDVDAKVWWKSNTLRAAIVCMVAGIVLVGVGKYGSFTGSETGNMVMSSGGGMSLGSLLSVFVRTALQSSPVTWTSGYGTSSYGN